MQTYHWTNGSFFFSLPKETILDENVFALLPSILIWVCAMYYYLFNFIGLFFCLHRSHHRRNHLFLLYNFSFSLIIFFGVRSFFFFKCTVCSNCILLFCWYICFAKRRNKEPNRMKENENRIVFFGA